MSDQATIKRLEPIAAKIAASLVASVKPSLEPLDAGQMASLILPDDALDVASIVAALTKDLSQYQIVRFVELPDAPDSVCRKVSGLPVRVARFWDFDKGAFFIRVDVGFIEAAK